MPQEAAVSAFWAATSGEPGITFGTMQSGGGGGGAVTVNVNGCGPATGDPSELESATHMQMSWSPAVDVVNVVVTLNAPLALWPLISRLPLSESYEAAQGA